MTSMNRVNFTWFGNFTYVHGVTENFIHPLNTLFLHDSGLALDSRSILRQALMSLYINQEQHNRNPFFFGSLGRNCLTGKDLNPKPELSQERNISDSEKIQKTLPD